MLTPGLPEMLIMLVLSGVGLVVPLLALYWVIRLAVRHGIADSRRKAAADLQSVSPTPGA